ncbi:DUF3152 domain-containing protein [Streptomyces oryzae]|uniref:DUF3152 domain-containing protein n=1 Tax=Streptomyces oryzae TaxID=1434886 RepID=A0ABS3XLS5_9ACTN|nr:DUF3152 domain-containing protein [Streptomyces oryzae]MBO8196362.1 DUF3152 domain-containing protein [Streptomyces oryzae]
MGRHSRKGKAGIGRGQERSQISEPPGPATAARVRPGSPTGEYGADGVREYGADGVPEYGTPASGTRTIPGAPSSAVPAGRGRPTGRPEPQGTPAHGVPAFTGEQPARGGHPQQPEGGPSAFRGRGQGRGQGHGPGNGHLQGYGYGQVPGQRGRSSGPRQEYLDAFDDDVFAAGAPGAGPPGRSPAEPFQAPVAAPPRPAAGDGTGGFSDGAVGDPPTGAPQTSAEQDPQPRKGGRGRAATGVVAAAITTVLAFVVAAQVTGGEQGSGDSARGLKTGERTPESADVPSAPERADRGTRPTPGGEPASYEAKMARQYPLADDLKGSGKFTPVPGHEKGPGKGEVVRYRVDVENGLPLDGKLFAEAVHKTLNDERSWAHGGKRSFERVSSGKADFVITLASPGTTDKWCAKSGLDTSEEKVSCDSAATERIMINAWRWARGAETYGPDKMHAYRQMLINHEVGHRLGHGHVGCPADGKPAPVMMQQTKYLTTHGKTCRVNAWPFPRG